MIVSLAADFSGFFLIGALIPAIGLVILVFYVVAHYFAGFALVFLIFPGLKHFIPKLILGIAIIVPAPWLTLGLLLAVVSQNRFVEALVVEGGTKALEMVELAVPVAGEAAAVATEAAADTATAAKAAKGAGAVSTAVRGSEAVKGAGEGREALKEGFERIKEGVDQADDEREGQDNAGQADEAMGELPSPEEEMIGEDFPEAEDMETINKGGAPKTNVVYGNFARPTMKPANDNMVELKGNNIELPKAS